MELASVGETLAASTPFDSWPAQMPRPARASSTVMEMAATMTRWVALMPLKALVSCSARFVSPAIGVLQSGVRPRRKARPALHLHAHDLAVGIDQLGSDGHHHLEAKIGLLDSQHGRVHVCTLPCHQVPCLSVGLGGSLVHFLERLLEQIAKGQPPLSTRSTAVLAGFRGSGDGAEGEGLGEVLDGVHGC